MHITYHKAMIDVYGHGDDPTVVHPCRACRPLGGTPDWSRTYVAIPSSSCWQLQLCIMPASLPISDGRLSYTSSEHIEGIPDVQITVHQTEAQLNSVWRDMSLEKTYNRGAKTKLFTDISQQPWRNTGELCQFWQQSQSRGRQWHTWI